MELIKITDLTAQMQISSRSVRYYEQVGLIHSTRAAFDKYRYFDAENVERLKQILVLRKMQIPIKDILRIYQSQDTSVLVEVFVDRIQAIDAEVTALSELKQIVDDFLQAMLQKGITRISALPLLYEQMDKQLDVMAEHHSPAYEQLSAVSEKLSKPLDVRIVELPSMRMLSSVHQETGLSDVQGFWDFVHSHNIEVGKPGQHTLLEYQDADDQTVVLQKLEEDKADIPFAQPVLPGGLFAVAGVYADEDLAAFYRNLVSGFDENPFYEVDYLHGGELRHAALVEAVLSPDGKREKLEVFLPVKHRAPNAALYEPCERVTDISPQEMEQANPALWAVDVPMDKLTPIFYPHYAVTDAGEAEYIAYIDKRMLSTEVRVKVPFRVDMEFRVDEGSGRFGYGSDEGSICLYHGENFYGINMHNNADSRLSEEALSFSQPVLGGVFSCPGLGKIKPDVYNSLTWIVGQKHFAVILNGEVRYCGTGFPYMGMDARSWLAQPILIGSNGQGKRYFRSVRVSQLRWTPRSNIKEGALTLVTKQSNNIIPGIHQLITMHYGENYWFNGCAKYVMEALHEPDYDYWFFSGLTGDNLAQVYAYDHFRGDGLTDYHLSTGDTQFIENVFDACGYASTFVTEKALNNNRDMYLKTLMAYIDKGVPVIRYEWQWSVIVGYEEYGKTLLCLTADQTTPERIPFDTVLPREFSKEQGGACGWVFVGEKRRQVELAEVYRSVIRNMAALLATKTPEYCLGAEAFRAWANEVESNKFDSVKPEDFNNWLMYNIYVCNLATNGSCLAFLEKAQQLCPEFGFLEEVRTLYRKMGHLWNDDNGNDLEALGGGFNITLGTLQDPEKRGKIAAKIREFAVCVDQVIALLQQNT